MTVRWTRASVWCLTSCSNVLASKYDLRDLSHCRMDPRYNNNNTMVHFTGLVIRSRLRGSCRLTQSRQSLHSSLASVNKPALEILVLIAVGFFEPVQIHRLDHAFAARMLLHIYDKYQNLLCCPKSLVLAPKSLVLVQTEVQT